MAALLCRPGFDLGQSLADQPVELKGHTDAVYDVAFSPDGKILASGSYDRTVVLWSVETRTKLAILNGHTDQVFRLRFSPDGSKLASCGGDGKVIVWDLASRERIRVLTGPGDPMIDADFSADGKRIATAGSRIQIWKQEDVLWSQPCNDLFFAVAFSPDGRVVACGTKDRVKIFGAASGKLLSDHAVGSGMVYQLDYSPDGKWLASASSDGTLTLQRTRGSESPISINADQTALFACEFSADGERLVSGGRDRAIRIWDVPSGRLLREEYGPRETILSVTFSPDGKQMAAGAYDGVIHVFSHQE